MRKKIEMAVIGLIAGFVAGFVLMGPVVGLMMGSLIGFCFLVVDWPETPASTREGYVSGVGFFEVDDD